MVPDVWSYPSRFQSSNAKRKSQVEDSKPLHKDVFLDLSRAPPRFNETAISEEPEEDNIVSDKSNQNQTGETTSRRESLNGGDIPQRNPQYCVKAGVSPTEQHAISGLVMSDEEQNLLETASSFLRNSSGESNSINDEMQPDTLSGGDTDADSEFASRKRRRESSGSSEKENVTIKSAKTVLNEKVEEDQEDLISELILAEAIWQEEEAGVVLVNERKELVEEKSSVSLSPTDSWEVVDCEKPNTLDQADGIASEQKQLDAVMEKPGHSKCEDMEKDIVTSKAINSAVFACLYSEDYSVGTTDVNQNILINSGITKTTPLADDSEYSRPAVSGARDNLHLDQSVQHDPFISTDPFQDRIPTPPGDLRLDESKFDNKGIELADFVVCGTTSQQLFEEESVVCIPQESAGLDDKRSDRNESKSPVSFSNSNDLKLTGDSSLVRDDIHSDSKLVDVDNGEDSVASHMVCLEFDEDSDTETESDISDEGESLWATFPEYFQPSRRLRYSSNKEAELSIAEEDQDEDRLDSTNTDRGVALVSVKELNTGYESNSKDTEDDSENQNGVSLDDDCEELSTASSESFEYTYEVNAEFPSESEEVSEDSGHVNFKEKNERGLEEICDQRDVDNSLPSHISMVSRDTPISDNCNISVDTLSSCNDKKSEVDRTTESGSAETKSPVNRCDQVHFPEKNEFAEMSNDISREEPPKTLPDCTRGNEDSSFDDSLKHDLEKTGILPREHLSLNDSEDIIRVLDRSYSPSDWIIPPPPSPTPELQKADIRIVSPPPPSPTLVKDELDDELKHLIVPPPPSSADSLPIISDIRIVSPPPLADLQNLLYDYDDVRFLSLTDDHKLAKSNVLIAARAFDSNFTEDKKIQTQKFKADTSFVTKEEGNANKSIVFSSREKKIFHSSDNYCKANQTPVKHSSATFVPKSRSLDSQPSLPNRSASSSFTSGGSRTTSKRFDREKRIFEDSPNKIVVSSPGLDNFENISVKSDNLKQTASFNALITNQQNISFESRSRIPSRQKPPVPPKPRIFRAATHEGEMETPSKPLANADAKQMYRRVNSPNVKGPLLTDLESSNITDISKKTSERFEALHQASPGANDTLAVDSQTTTDDIPYRNEVILPREKRGTTRSLSFTCRSPYVPAPYLSSRTQSLYTAQSSAEGTHSSSPHTNSLSTAGFPISTSVSPQSSRNEPYSAGNELSFNRQRPLLIRYPSSHLSLQETNSDLDSKSEIDTNRAVPNPSTQSLNTQLSTVDLQEDTPPPIPDSPPPPLPDSSPPKMIPGFDADDFDFGEPLREALQDDIQSDIYEPGTFLPSRAKDLKFNRFSASFDNKQEDSSSTFTARREKIYGGNALSRSLTITSFPRDVNQRSLSVDWASRRDPAHPDSGIKCSSFSSDGCFNLGDATATSSLNSLEECRPKALKTRCCNVCEEGLSRVSVLKNRLDVYLNGDPFKRQQSEEAKNWPLVFQNSARFLACDIKVISSSVKRGSPQVVSAIQTSLDSLEKLAESCEKTFLMLIEKSKHNGRGLVVMVIEVLDQYRDIISTVKTASGQPPDHPDVEVLVKKTNAMATLIASLIRALRKY